MPDMVPTRLSRRDLLLQGGIRGAGLGAGGILLPHIIPAQAASSGKAGAHPVTITVREHQQLRLRLLKDEIPRFEAAMADRGTPIKVRLQVGPTSDNDFLTQLTVAYTAGVGPDVTSFPVSRADAPQQPVLHPQARRGESPAVYRRGDTGPDHRQGQP
jgi:ABC-type glycerol-3-phosphate transport system substrate-binding protein